MAKAKTSKKQKLSEKKLLKPYSPFTSSELKNSKAVVRILLECIKTNDLETFRDVLVSHLVTANKTAIAKEAGIGRRTLYDLLDPNKEFNPGLVTVSSIIKCIGAYETAMSLKGKLDLKLDIGKSRVRSRG
jgi:DNA-binding phage protein